MTELEPKPSALANQNGQATPILIRVLIWLGAVGALLMVTMLVMFFRWTNSYVLHAFRVPSDSMCAAICMNERIIAGMDAFDRRPPRRGEVILFLHESSNTNFVKRIAAVGGDTVEPGPDNSVLVNGEAVKVPGACGNPIRRGESPYEPIQFESLKVPRDSFYVIGDNLSQSFDSRFSGFGLVKRDQVRGKALFIYSSPGKSRIGCSIR